MNENQKTVFVQSQIACAIIELESMKAANAERERRGESQAYPEESFIALLDRYMIGHNAVIEYLRS